MCAYVYILSEYIYIDDDDDNFSFCRQEDLGKRVMELTDNNGMGRIVEASGAASLLNKSFSFLRKVGIAEDYFSLFKPKNFI